MNNENERQHQQLKQISTAALLEESNHLRYVYYGMITLALLIAIFIVWSAFVVIKETAQTMGELVPEGQVNIVQHLEGGVVEKVYVKNGDSVKKGQVLLDLNPQEKQAELMELRSREVSLLLNIERLKAFIQGVSPDRVVWKDAITKAKYSTGKNKLDIDAILANEKNHLASQNAERLNNQMVLQSMINQRKQKLVEIENQLRVWKRHLELLTQEFNMYQKLQAKDLVSRKDYLVVLRDMNKAKGEGVSLISQIDQMKQGIIESEGKLRELNSKYIQDAQKELGDNSDQLLEVEYKIEKNLDQLTRMHIVASVAGLVKGLDVLSGNVIKPGGEILQIVPQDERLIAETRINPRDIGFVKVGDKVRIKIMTFDYARYGMVRGYVQSISATTFLDKEEKPYYRARIVLDQQYIKVMGGSRRLLAGMTVEADIITGEKNLLSYLLKPIYLSMENSFKER